MSIIDERAWPEGRVPAVTSLRSARSIKAAEAASARRNQLAQEAIDRVERIKAEIATTAAKVGSVRAAIAKLGEGDDRIGVLTQTLSDLVGYRTSLLEDRAEAIARRDDVIAAAAVDLSPTLVQVRRQREIDEGWYDALRIHSDMGGGYVVLGHAEPSQAWLEQQSVRQANYDASIASDLAAVDRRKSLKAKARAGTMTLEEAVAGLAELL